MNKIETREQYEALTARMEELLAVVDNETPANDKNLIELEFISTLIADYEEVHFPMPSPTLAEVIKLRMFELKMTQAEIAKQIGVSASRMSQYLSGKSEPTLKVARVISQKLSIDADIVLGI